MEGEYKFSPEDLEKFMEVALRLDSWHQILFQNHFYNQYLYHGGKFECSMTLDMIENWMSQ